MKLPASLVAAVVFAAAFAACSKQNEDELAARQRLDGAVAGATDAEMSASRAADRTAQLTADMGITAKVNAALVADDQLKASQIDVDTREGHVTLTGQAMDALSRDRATTLASAVDGVKQVNNQLVVSTNG